ncbi:MAG: hypothetical protein IJT44_04240 [Clostridia bacterium]|nr:hypothetical protein [Clostridia bacterium]
MKNCRKTVSLILALLLMLCSASVGGMTVFAAAQDDGQTDEVTVKVVNSGLEVTAGYKETMYFEFEAANMPKDASIHVFCNGEDRGESVYIYVKDATEDYTVEAKVLDKDGKVLTTSDVIKVTVKNGFFDRAKAFLKKTFGTAGDAIMDVLGAIFMRIWIFFHR